VFTGERLIPREPRTAEEHILELRHRFAYETASSLGLPGTRALDIGCGEGYGVTLMRSRGLLTHGLDVALDAFASPRSGPDGACWAVYDGLRLPLADDSVEVVTCFQVVEHVADPATLALEVSRVLRPGGRLFMTTPNRLLRLHPSERPWNRFHLREFDAGGLHGLLAAYFASVRIAGVRAIPEIETFELTRLRSIRRLVALDPLDLRGALPEGLNRRVRAFLRSLLARRRRGATWRAFSVEDFHLDEARVEGAMDLFAICASDGPAAPRVSPSSELGPVRRSSVPPIQAANARSVSPR
jgi:SAM-dependent methyltransferase